MGEEEGRRGCDCGCVSLRACLCVFSSSSSSLLLFVLVAVGAPANPIPAQRAHTAIGHTTRIQHNTQQKTTTIRAHLHANTHIDRL